MRTRVFSLLLVFLACNLVVACGPVVTYADTQSTAVVRQCWPNTPAYPTPPPITVTPLVTVVPTPWGTPWPAGVPTPTRLPTTTPYPRCAPEPGETLIPWPTPVPMPPPYPTKKPIHAGGGSGLVSTLELPEKVLTVDVASHPTQSWAAVGAVVFSGNNLPERAFVSVQQPDNGVFGTAQQVDIPPATLGRYSRTLRVAITGDDTVHAFWGMSDPDFVHHAYPARVWTAFSKDYGRTWSQPQALADDCRRVNGAATNAEGWIVVSLACDGSDTNAPPALVVRTPQGVWQPVQRLGVPGWIFSEGAAVIVGEGAAARAMVLHVAGVAGIPQLFVFSRELASASPWQVVQIPFTAPVLGERMWKVRGLVFRPLGAAQDSVLFSWVDADLKQRAYAVLSQDGGKTWLPPHEMIAVTGAEQLFSATPAYDVRTNRLITVWPCCQDVSWEDGESTHYSRVSQPGSQVWAYEGAQRVPLILGARSADETVSAQAPNSRNVWIAWIEQRSRVEIRALDVATLLRQP